MACKCTLQSVLQRQTLSGKVTFKSVVNPDCSTKLSLHYLEDIVFSVMNVNVGLEDKNIAN